MYLLRLGEGNPIFAALHLVWRGIFAVVTARIPRKAEKDPERRPEHSCRGGLKTVLRQVDNSDYTSKRS